MDRERIEKDHYLPLYRFAWALSGDETQAATLARRVLEEEAWHPHVSGGPRSTEVALFTLAFQLAAGFKPIPCPPAHDRVAALSALSLQQASGLSTEALLHSFRELELPQRAALVLFYTTQCSIHDIAVILHQSHEETVAIISRGKSEWMHILQREGESGARSEGEP